MGVEREILISPEISGQWIQTPPSRSRPGHLLRTRRQLPPPNQRRAPSRNTSISVIRGPMSATPRASRRYPDYPRRPNAKTVQAIHPAYPSFLPIFRERRMEQLLQGWHHLRVNAAYDRASNNSRNRRVIETAERCLRGTGEN